MKSRITKWHANKVASIANKSVAMAIKEAAIYLTNYVKGHFTLQGTYERYTSQKGRKRKRHPEEFAVRGASHWSSAPGEPPAIDTGNLRASIQYQVLKEGDKTTARVGSDLKIIAARRKKKSTESFGTDLDYGYFLEIGTSRMAARPYLRPAIRHCAETILGIFKKHTKRLPENA